MRVLIDMTSAVSELRPTLPLPPCLRRKRQTHIAQSLLKGIRSRGYPRKLDAPSAGAL